MFTSMKKYSCLLVIANLLFTLQLSFGAPWMGNLTQVMYKKPTKHLALKITFTNVVSDSRCPIGANCIAAGSAIITLKLGKLKTNLSIGQVVKFDYKKVHYEVQLIDLKPAPEKNKIQNIADSFIYLQISEVKQATP